MALLWCDGFDHYGEDETKMTEGPYDSVGSVFSLSSANKRTGNNCLRRDNTKSTSVIKRLIDNPINSVGTGAAFFIDRMPESPTSYKVFEFSDTSDNPHISMYVEPNGAITIRLGESLDIVSMSDAGVITHDDYFHVEFACIADSGLLVQKQVSGDIATATYDGNLKDVSSQLSGHAYSFQLSRDGINAFAFDDLNRRIYSYTLSNAFDISSAIYDGVLFSTSTQSATIHSIRVANDGMNLYATGSVDSIVYQYSMSSAWDLSTIMYTGKSFDMSGVDSSTYDVDFDSTGTMMFSVGATFDKVYQFTLTTPWDVSTASYDNISLDISNETGNSHAIKVSLNGDSVYVLGTFDNIIYQYNLDINFDISNYSSVSSFSTTAQTGEIHGFDISSDGLSLYAIDNTSLSIYQYDIQPSYEVVSDGFVEVRINGVTYISSANAKTTFTEDRLYGYVSIACGSNFSHLVTTDIDDWFIWDTSGAWNNSFIGDRRCYLIKPNQDTNISDFDPSSGQFGYKMIDDDSPDDDSTYIIAEAYLQSGSPLSGTSEFEIEGLPDGTSLISAVSLVTRASKTDSTSAEVFTSINSGVNSLSQTAHILTTSYQYYNDIYEYDPATISSFTKDGFNALTVSVTADDLDPGVAFESPEDGIGSPTDEDPVIPSDQRIAFYTMENISGSTLIDEEGNFNGTIVGATQVSALGGSALDFGTGSDRVDPASGLMGGLSEWNIALLCRPTDSADGSIFEYGWDEAAGAPGDSTGAIIILNEPSFPRMRLLYRQSDLSATVLTTSFSLTNNTDSTVIFGFNGTNIFIEVDGVEESTGFAFTISPGSGKTSTIGNRESAADGFGGLIGKFAVYSKNLSEAERQIWRDLV